MIVRLIEDEKDRSRFAGVYHRWDGYPEGLGKQLYRAIKEDFAGGPR